jgi:uncharacterized protein (TIRG00374 family)
MASPDMELEHQPEPADEPTDQQAERELSIGRRFADWKTVVSFGFAVVVLAVAVIEGHIDPVAMWHRLRTLNLAIFLGAFLLYYATFPLRGYRWKTLLRNAYRDTHSHVVDDMSVGGLTEIIYISWFVNCVVPAKLGDLYRAYLAKLWVHISWTKTIGTVLAERIVDILVLSLLLAATGLVLFHNRLGSVSVILLFGVGLAVVGVVGLILMKTMSGPIRQIVPERFLARYVAFEEGTLSSFRRVPFLLLLTALIWGMEGGRLTLVITSLGLQLHAPGLPHSGFSLYVPMLFLALGTAVLTTVPFTPGGLGLVEVGILGLMIYLGMPKADAAAVVLVDRILSYYSVAFFGFLVYLLSKRSHFRHPV